MRHPTRDGDIGRGRVRASRHYDLVPLAELDPATLTRAAWLPGPAEPYAVLRPRSAALPWRVVARETAVFIRSLHKPVAVESRATTGLDSGHLLRLVYDDVLEVEHDGGYVSGGAYYTCLDADRPPPGPGIGALGRLSVDAVRHAQASRVVDPHALATRLYLYHRFPVTPAWRLRFPSEEAVARHAGYRSVAAGPAGKAGWRESPPSRFNQGWVAWRAPPARRAGSPRGGYKLYVSPRAEFIRDAVRSVLAALPDSGAVSFKAARDVYGLLRPDKIAVYFRSLADLRAAARVIGRALSGVPAHGVPFTAGLGSGGLLSWGMDPPASEKGHGSAPRQSWRTWVSNRAADALVTAARCHQAERPAWQFALRRLSLEGVDIDGWTPPVAAWAPGGPA